MGSSPFLTTILKPNNLLIKIDMALLWGEKTIQFFLEFFINCRVKFAIAIIALLARPDG